MITKSSALARAWRSSLSVHRLSRAWSPAYKTVLWWLEGLRWHLGGPVRRRHLRCDHPCCVNKPHTDLPWGECPCLDRYRSLLKLFVQREKERRAEDLLPVAITELRSGRPADE